MDLQIISDLRAAVRAKLLESYSATPVYMAELTNINTGDDDENIDEFFTVFLGDGEEDQDGEDVDGSTYLSETQLTVGYFNDEGRGDQSVLDATASTVRALILELEFAGDITRAGWKYIPPIDGATAGINFHFNVSFSN